MKDIIKLIEIRILELNAKAEALDGYGGVLVGLQYATKKQIETLENELKKLKKNEK